MSKISHTDFTLTKLSSTDLFNAYYAREYKQAPQIKFTEHVQQHFTCELELDNVKYESSIYNRKSYAKADLCYNICCDLYNKSKLDYFMLNPITKNIKTQHFTILSTKNRAKHGKDVEVNTKLFHLYTVDDSIGILTKTCIPEEILHEVEIYVNNKSRNVKWTYYGEYKITDEDYNTITKFHITTLSFTMRLQIDEYKPDDRFLLVAVKNNKLDIEYMNNCLSKPLPFNSVDRNSLGDSILTTEHNTNTFTFSGELVTIDNTTMLKCIGFQRDVYNISVNVFPMYSPIFNMDASICFVLPFSKNFMEQVRWVVPLLCTLENNLLIYKLKHKIGVDIDDNLFKMCVNYRETKNGFFIRGNSIMLLYLSEGLFYLNPNDNEDELSMKRANYCCSQYISSKFNELELYKFIPNYNKTYKHYVPPGFGVSEIYYNLATKLSSNIIQPLFYAYYLSGGGELCKLFMKYMEMPVVLTNKIELPILDVTITNEDVNVIESIINYKFKSKHLLSYVFSLDVKSKMFQRLEWLGDAVLGHFVTTLLCNAYNNLSPGTLTHYKHTIEKNATLGCSIIRSKLYKYINVEDEVTINSINNAVTSYANRTINERIIPKILGDVFEALIAVIYLDSDHNMGDIHTVFNRLMDTLVLNDCMNKVFVSWY